jgi:hypothetical protein
MIQCREAKGEEVVEEVSCLLLAIWDAGRLAGDKEQNVCLLTDLWSFYLFVYVFIYLFLLIDSQLSSFLPSFLLSSIL